MRMDITALLETQSSKPVNKMKEKRKFILNYEPNSNSRFGQNKKCIMIMEDNGEIHTWKKNRYLTTTFKVPLDDY